DGAGRRATPGRGVAPPGSPDPDPRQLPQRGDLTLRSTRGLEPPVVSRSYRLGVQIVLGAIFLSAGAGLRAAGRVPPATARTAHDLGAAARSLGPFRLEERSGRIITAEDLADRVVIASFIFTRCPLSCPRITGVMKGLQSRLAGTDVLLVSFSV